LPRALAGAGRDAGHPDHLTTSRDVSEPDPNVYPPRLLWLIVSVLALSVPVAAGATVRITLDSPRIGVALAALLFLSLAQLAELKPVPLEEEGLTSVSLAFVFILATVILFGWEYAVLIAGISALVAQIVEGKPALRTAYNTGVYVLSAFAAALPVLVLGSGATKDPVAITVYALAGGAAFVVVNFTLIAIAISLHQRVPLRPLLEEDVHLVGPAFAIQAFLAALAAALWVTDPRLLVLMAGPLFTVTLYQRSSLASRIARKDAHTDSLTLLGNNRSYELSLASVLEDASGTGDPVSLCLVDVDNFKQINDIYGHAQGDRVLVEVARLLTSQGDGAKAYRLGGDEFTIIVPSDEEGARRHLDAVYLRISNESFAHGEPVTISSGVATFPRHADDLETLEHRADGALYHAKQNGKNRWCLFDPELVRMYSSDELERRAEHQARRRAAENLVRVVDAKDAYTGAHSERVALFVEGIARRLGLDDELVEQLKLAGRLHDLGKIAISDRVLQKPSELTPQEMRHVATHSELGASLLDGMEIRPVDVWIRHHHEHWDGSGYPNGLAGEEIPFGSRVILVADAYDAMTTHRSYRTASLPEDALAELTRLAGIQFDPVVVAALKAHLEGAGIVSEREAGRKTSLELVA
jgi:diguanylate cyclase (GGDEF)-like protein